MNSPRRFSVTLGSRTRRPYQQELENRLDQRRRQLEEDVQRETHRPRILTDNKGAHFTNLLSPPPFERRRSSATYIPEMEELKKRLSKSSVSSTFDVDRIVKESKTTTITESRETIHFRHQESPLLPRKLSSLPQSPMVDLVPQRRTSITTSPRFELAERSTRIYENLDETREGGKNEKGDGRPSMSEKEKVEADKLLSEYAHLDSEIKDINQRNKELKEKFLADTKQETPILTGGPSAKNGPNILRTTKTSIDQWDTVRARTVTRSRSPAASASLTTAKKDDRGRTVDSRLLTVPASSKQPTGCPFNVIK